jgi:indole-3-glycerol phosphate synthase
MSGPASPDLLGAILACSRRIVETRRQSEPIAALERRARDVPSSRGAFGEAIGRPGLNVIAECKRRSPAKGVLRRDYDPAAIASSYAASGAAAVSVLTEPAFFDGSLDHLRQVRGAVSLPLLRKDFIVDEYQVVEARAAGAAAVLLIVAALDDAALAGLLAATDRWGLEAVVEVHDEPDLARALQAESRIIGVNNRNLRTLDVAIENAFRLVGAIPEDRLAVAESGIRAGTELAALHQAGYDAFLVGERLMGARDPGDALRALLGEAARRDGTIPSHPPRAADTAPAGEA